MDKPKLPKREKFPNLNDYLKEVSRYNQAIETTDEKIYVIPNFKIDDKDVQSWLRLNKEFGVLSHVKRFTQQDVDDLRLLSELAFDGACISESDEQLINRVNKLADKIQEMII